MLTFEEFKNELVSGIRAEGYGVKAETMNRSNGETYVGIMFEQRSGISPVIHVEPFYEQYLADNTPIGILVHRCIDIFESKPEGLNLSPEEIQEWDKVKDFIYPRLVPDNEVYADKLGMPIANLKAIFVVRAMESSSGLGEAVIIPELLRTWGVTLDEVIDVAFDNLEKAEVFMSDMGGAFTVLSNKYNTKGAVECLNKVAMQKAVDELGEVYIIPSSLDEVLLIPRENMDPEDLKEMVKIVNSEAVEEKDRLSENVYIFNGETLEVVA